jgi:hypothetical protein
VQPDQELLALGLSNVAGAFFQAYPASGSLSRSAVASAAGAQSPLHGLVQVRIPSWVPQRWAATSYRDLQPHLLSDLHPARNPHQRAVAAAPPSPVWPRLYGTVLPLRLTTHGSFGEGGGRWRR